MRAIDWNRWARDGRLTLVVAIRSACPVVLGASGRQGRASALCLVLQFPTRDELSKPHNDSLVLFELAIKTGTLRYVHVLSSKSRSCFCFFLLHVCPAYTFADNAPHVVADASAVLKVRVVNLSRHLLLTVVKGQRRSNRASRQAPRLVT